MIPQPLLVIKLLLRRRVVIIGMLPLEVKVTLIKRICRRPVTRGLPVRLRSLMLLRCLLLGRRGSLVR